jgi:glycosyltransferase involved in cell wall biosynthesis
MSAPLASIIIRCYNEAEHIGKLLHGIDEQRLADHEIVLVDSGSTDGTLEIAEDYGVEKITHIAPEAFSFGRALNHGCEAADGRYCVMASAHVYPKRDDWLNQLIGKFDADDDIALVYGKQRGNEVTTFSENQIFQQWFPEHDIDIQDHPFCNNANAAIRRDVWEEYPYNEQLTGLEDVDWAKRVQEAGYTVAYSSEAEIVHVHDETAKEIYNRYRREAYAHKQIMPERSFSFLDFLRLSMGNILSDYRAALAEGALKETVLEIPKFRVLQFLGTYRGFNREGPISDKLYQRFYYPDRDTYPPSESDDSTGRDQTNLEDVSEIDYPEDDGLVLSSDD